MPHFIVEYSHNLAQRHDFQALSDLIRDAANRTGVFPLGGIRVRMHPADICTIADGHVDNAFVAILVRIGAGRDTATKNAAGQAVFDEICQFFITELEGGHFMISLDIVENSPEVSFKRNTVHGRLKGDN